MKKGVDPLIKRLYIRLEDGGFMRRVIVDNKLSSFKFGPPGRLLLRNVKREWFLSNVVLRNSNVFPVNFVNSKPNQPIDLIEGILYVIAIFTF